LQTRKLRKNLEDRYNECDNRTCKIKEDYI
jgi:hypothetical protein